MLEQKRIVFVIESLKVGGAERVVANLAAEFDKNRWDVEIVIIRETGLIEAELPESVDVHVLDSDRTLASIPRLVSYFRERQPDIVIANMTHVNVVAALSVNLSRIDTDLVVVEHSMLSERIERIDNRKERLTALLASRLYLWADSIVAVSSGLADDVAAVTGINRSLITTIYNPIDIGHIREQATKDIKHEWFKDSELSVIIGVGRLEVRKDFPTLLRAFARVVQNQQCRLVICGDGPQQESLRDLADQLDIQERVCFLGWVENPYKYMSQSDVFVLSSSNEGFANVIVEALAVGCPVVSTDCESGPAEILEDGAWGKLVPVGDEKVMANSIKQVLVEPPEMDSLRKRASEFDTPIIYQSYINLFLE